MKRRLALAALIGCCAPVVLASPAFAQGKLTVDLVKADLDNADFERLAAACTELGRWEFQFVVAPLVIPRGTGSPVNPLAIL